MANDKGLSRTVTVKNVQVKPSTSTPVSSFAPPKPVATTTPKATVTNK